MIYLYLGLAGLSNGVMDLIDMKPYIFSWIPDSRFKVWLLSNGVYYKQWMYPFFTFMKDGWHFFKSLTVVFVILAITNNLLTAFYLSIIWMLGHEIVFYTKWR